MKLAQLHMTVVALFAGVLLQLAAQLLFPQGAIAESSGSNPKARPLAGQIPKVRRTANHAPSIPSKDKAGSGSSALADSIEALRLHVPKGRKMAEVDGFSIEDAYGKQYSMAQLDECADKLVVTSKSDAQVLLRYLDDRDAKVRYLAASALERRLQAYPDGMVLNHIVKLESAGHKKMVALFAAKIKWAYPSASMH